jgi:pimeloyl-ACP methyl ester carboxylesterase
MHTATVDVDGQHIGYLASAGTGRPVVLVHGNSMSARTWRDILDGPLGQRYRCLALDLPGHGDSAPAADQAAYALPGHAAALTAFAGALGAADAVFVGWSLGGNVILEAAPALPGAAGFVIFGAAPVASPADLQEAFLPEPAASAAFTADVSPDLARAFAASLTAPGAPLPLEEFVTDVLRTDPAARAGLAASVAQARFADQQEIAGALAAPLAILHGEHDQLISLPFIQRQAIPALWRGQVQVIRGAGHALHREQPAAFTALLDSFLADLP